MEIKGLRQLYNKLLLIYTIILIGVALAFVIYFLSSTRNRILETNLDYTRMMSQEVSDYLEESAEIAGYIHEDLYKSSMEMEDLIHYLNDETEIYQKYRLDTYSESGVIDYKGIEEFIKGTFEAYESLKRIAVLSYEKGDFISFTDNGNPYHSMNSQKIIERIESGDLAEDGEFSFLKEIRDPTTMQSVGCMIITFDGGKFQKVQRYYSGAELLVYSDAGTVIFNSSSEEDAKKIMEVHGEDELKKVLRAYVEKIETDDYHAVCYLSEKEAAAVPPSIILMILLFGCGVMTVGELLLQYYLRRLAGRLNCILNGMTKVMQGDLSVRLPGDKNGDELDIISIHFNEMCEKLDEHIQKQYLAEIEQKNAEMSALQSQINPHFLYNTLEAIRMKAICNGDREVGKMLYSMAVTFRSQIKEADVITMAQELHYCKKYLELFEYRYQGQFQSRVICPDEYLQVPIIKFVLQPIIENYFIHGIRMGEKDNVIQIMVEKEEEEYKVTVEDNGKGMREEEIRTKNRELEANEMKKNASIGIANVNRRIKAVYGREYGIRIESRAEGGIRVILRFKPHGRRKDEESNAGGR